MGAALVLPISRLATNMLSTFSAIGLPLVSMASFTVTQITNNVEVQSFFYHHDH
jgi:hypothetical protein